MLRLQMYFSYKPKFSLPLFLLQIKECIPFLNPTDKIHRRDHHSEETNLQYNLAACHLPVNQ